LFDDFVKVVALSNYATKNTYAKAELNFVVSPDSVDTGGRDLKTKFSNIQISKSNGTFGQAEILYVGKGTDNSGDGKPDTNSTSVLTPDNTDLSFTLQILFSKDSTYKNFYNITVEAQPNKLFDNFSAGNEGGSAGVYKFSDIKEIRNTPPNQVATFNMFVFDFDCKVNKSGGLTVNDTNLSISFKLTVANSSGSVHPIEGVGAPGGSSSDTTDTTDDGNWGAGTTNPPTGYKIPQG